LEAKEEARLLEIASSVNADNMLVAEAEARASIAEEVSVHVRERRWVCMCVRGGGCACVRGGGCACVREEVGVHV
jgi:hypothetical protein